MVTFLGELQDRKERVPPVGFLGTMKPFDQEAFVRELTRHQRRLLGLVRCLVFRTSDVEDVWQELNVDLWRRSSEFTPGTDFWAWASQIARYRVLTYSRQVGRDRHVFCEALLEQLIADFGHFHDRTDAKAEALERCMDQLSHPQRLLLEHRYVSGHSLDQIASQLKRPVESVRQTLYRIRKQLLECIERKLVREVTP